jgi:membrane dipeptidase
MIVDAKNDLLTELVYRRYEANPLGRYWLPKLEMGGVRLQVCPFYAVELDVLPELALRVALDHVAAFRRAVRENADRVRAVRSRDDLDALDAGHELGLMLAMEGAEALGYDPDGIEIFWDLGVRMASLTWNRRNPFADGAAEMHDGGLSNLGVRLVRRMTTLGMLVDLAHASERTFEQVLDLAPERSVLVSHSTCRAVADARRGLSDAQLRALAEHGGVLCIMLVAGLIDPARPTIDRVIDHIDHAVDVMGIAHVGLGGNFREQIESVVPMGPMPEMEMVFPAGANIRTRIPRLSGPEDYPNLVERLTARGFSGARLEAVLAENLMRLFRVTLPATG